MSEATISDTPTDAVNPFEKPETPSIVDTILDLDEFLSGDVRLAEKTAYFTTEPQLEAEIDELEAKLAELTDEFGNPVDLAAGDVSVSEGRHPAYDLADEITAKRARLNKSRRGVRVRQLNSTEWAAFKEKHKKPLADPEHERRQAMWDELIVACAIRPEFTPEKLKKLRTMVGDPQVAEIELACWDVCTKSGVSVPKSPLSSLVLKHQARAKS